MNYDIACTNTTMLLVNFFIWSHLLMYSYIFDLMYVVFIKIIFVFLSGLLGTICV